MSGKFPKLLKFATHSLSPRHSLNPNITTLKSIEHPENNNTEYYKKNNIKKALKSMEHPEKNNTEYYKKNQKGIEKHRAPKKRHTEYHQKGIEKHRQPRKKTQTKKRERKSKNVFLRLFSKLGHFQECWQLHEDRHLRLGPCFKRRLWRKKRPFKTDKHHRGFGVCRCSF